MVERTRFTLGEDQIPQAWYNISADLPVPQSPPLHPGTHQPLGPADLAPLFPMALIMQEVSTEREIEIPEPVRDLYKQYRPSPLVRALRLEKALDTPAHIYYKNESVSPAGSHKPNTAIPQAFYNKEEGIKRIATETGAGQWGSALAYAGAMFGLEVKVYMVRASYDQKPYRRLMMETYGASVVASPSMDTAAGRAILAEHPEQHRFTRHRHQRGRRGHGQARRHPLLAGLRSQPRHAPPDGHRPRVDQADGDGGRGAGHHHRLRRRRLQLRRPHLPVARPDVPRRPQVPGHRRGARGCAEHDSRPLRLRLRRHGQDGADGQDVYARPRLHPGADPRRRSALPRHVAAGQPAQARGLHRGPQRSPAPLLRGGHPVRPNRGPDPGARVDPRDPRRHRRGSRGQEDPARRRSSSSTCRATATST